MVALVHELHHELVHLIGGRRQVLGPADDHLAVTIAIDAAYVAVDIPRYSLDKPLRKRVVHVFRCRGQGVLVVDRLVQLASRGRHLQSIVVPEDGIGLGKGQRAALDGVRVVCAARHVVFEISLVIARELQGIHGALLIMKRVPSLRRAPARVIKRQRKEENPYSHSIVVFAVRRTIRIKSCYVVQPAS